MSGSSMGKSTGKTISDFGQNRNFKSIDDQIQGFLAF